MEDTRIDDDDEDGLKYLNPATGHHLQVETTVPCPGRIP